MKMTAGWCFLAAAKRALTIFSPSPTYLEVSEEAEMLKNAYPLSVATAFASIVLPVPSRYVPLLLLLLLVFFFTGFRVNDVEQGVGERTRGTHATLGQRLGRAQQGLRPFLRAAIWGWSLARCVGLRLGQVCGAVTLAPLVEEGDMARGEPGPLPALLAVRSTGRGDN